MADGATAISQRAGIVPELLVWLSPAFPVGAFAYSHGLELAIGRGWLRDRVGLQDWLGELVKRGSLRADLILLAEAWRAANLDDAVRLAHCNDVALALQPSAERYLEAVTQGNAFLIAIEAAWPPPRRHLLDGLATNDVPYPVAVGAVTAAHSVAVEATLVAYAVAFASTLVSAAIRLSLIGQTDGQRVIAGLMPALECAASDAARSTLDDLGTSTLRADLASLAHETQYTRLFRS